MEDTENEGYEEKAGNTENEEKDAKRKALELLLIMDRTEADLRQRLLKRFPSEETVNHAIEYVRSYGYLDDAGYVKRHVANWKVKKSRQEVLAMLIKKGVEKDMARQAVKDGYLEDEEEEAIRHAAEKKGYDVQSMDDTKKQKIYGYLARRGFSRRNILRVMGAKED